MRAVLEQHVGERIYVFTTHGHVHAGVLTAVLEDVIDVLAPDRRTHIFVNLTDVSGVRTYDEGTEEDA
jgi:hypothetical protein